MVQIFVLALLIIINGLLVMSEIALVSARKGRLEGMAKKGDAKAKAEAWEAKAKSKAKSPD